MSISTDSDRSDHEPSTLTGLRSPLYGTATFTTLSPATSSVALSPSIGSSTRLSVPSRSATPSSSADNSYTRRSAVSSNASSYDTRSYSDNTRTYSDSRSESYESYVDENDNSIDETAEVEEVLSRSEDDTYQSTSLVSRSERDSDAVSSSYSASGYSSAVSGASGTNTNASSDSRSYVSASSNSNGEPLNFDRERRALSSLSERTDLHSPSLISGTTSTGLFQNIFSSTFASARPTSIFSARTFYTNGSATSGGTLSPPPSIPSLHSQSLVRPATPERYFKPAPPTGRRVGNLVASFESDTSITRPGSAPLGARSPSPYGSSSRSTSPVKYSHSRSGSSSVTGSGSSLSGYGHTQSQSVSSYLSPSTVTASSISRSTLSISNSNSNSNSGSNTITAGSGTSSETERPRSPLTSVRNIVTAWKDRSPERLSARTAGSSYVSSASSASSRSSALQSQTQFSQSSAASGPSLTSTSASSVGFGLGFGFGDNFLSVRRRTTASNVSRDTGSESNVSQDDSRSATESNTYTNADTNTHSLGRSDSLKSSSTGTGGSSVFDLSELDSFIRGGQEPLRIGQLWYLNVHAPPPFRWQRCQAVLYPSTLLLSWIAPSGGRGVVTLDLIHCTEVRSVPSPSQPSARDDIGSIAARLQMGDSSLNNGYDLVEMLCPFQLLYTDGVERLGAESARERVRWVSAIWEALDRSAGPPDRSMTRSPTASVRTARSSRSATSSVVSTNSGSSSTNYLPPSDFESTALTRTSRSSLSRNSLSGTSSYGLYSQTHSADDSVVSSRTDNTGPGIISLIGGLLHPYSMGAAPSRSSSLRRTSSLADLDQEFASALSASGITFDSRTRTGTDSGISSSVASSRWTRTRAPSETGASSVGPSESASNPRRIRASTFYDTRAREVTSESATEVVPSTLSLRGPGSASLLGDSHSGPTTTEEREVPSQTTNTGLSRQSAVRRRTPRAARSYSESASGRSSDDIDYTQTTETPTFDQSQTSSGQLSSLQQSYTTTSYDISDYYYERSYTSSHTPTVSEESTIQARQQRPKAVTTPRKPVTTPRKVKSVSEADDVFLTPIASRPATTYHSITGTPTPSSTSLPSTEYNTAYGMSKASTEYQTAILCKSEKASSVYTTCDLCPSTPPVSVTEFYTAECRCKPKEPTVGSVSSLSRPASLYEPSTVQTVPTVKEVETPLPGSVTEESLLKSVVEEEKRSTLEPSTPSSVSSVPESPTIMKNVTPTPSSLTKSSRITPEPKTPTRASSQLTTPSSPSYIETYKTESSITPKSKTRYVPSQTSVKSSEPSLSDYESSVFLPSPSVHSIPIQDPVDVSFETSFLRPVSDLYESVAPSPFMPKGIVGLTEVPHPPSPAIRKVMSAYSSTETPISTSLGTTTSLSSSTITTPSSERTGTETITRSYVSPEPATPSVVSSPSSVAISSSVVSSLTKSSALRAPSVPEVRTVTASISAMTPSSGARSLRAPTASEAHSTTASISAITPSSGVRTLRAPTASEARSATASIGALTPSTAIRSLRAPTVSEARSATASIGSITPSGVSRSLRAPTVSEARSATISVGELTPSSSIHSLSEDDVMERGTASPSSLTESSVLPEYDGRSMLSVPYTAVSSLTASSPFGDDITLALGSAVTVSRTPSSISDVSTTSYSSSLFAPTVLEEEEPEEQISSPATMPTLLSSRSATPRPMTPASIPLPSTPSLGSTTPTPSSESLDTPRTETRSLHTETSVVSSSILEAPREEILTHDVNRLLRYLHDLDQIRGDEGKDMKDHLQRIEDELRDLSEYLRQPKSPKIQVIYPQPQVLPQPQPQPQYIPQYQPQPVSVGVGRTPRRTPVDYRNVPPAPVTDAGSVTPRTAAQATASTPRPTVAEEPRAISGSSSSPLPVPEPHPREEQSSVTPSIRSVTPPPPPQPVVFSPTPSISSITDGEMSYLSSHHSDDLGSLVSLEHYPAVPLSPPGSPNSPSDSGSGWSVSSSEAPWPPSSMTPSSVPRSSTASGVSIPPSVSSSVPASIPKSLPESEYLGADLTPESPLPLPTPTVRAAGSPLPSLVSAESPIPPVSLTPSIEAVATPLPASPMPHAPFTTSSPLPSSTPREMIFASDSSPPSSPPSSSDPSSSTPSYPSTATPSIPSSSTPSIIQRPPSVYVRQPASPVLSMSEVESIHEVPIAVYPDLAIVSAETTPMSEASPLPIPPGMLDEPSPEQPVVEPPSIESTPREQFAREQLPESISPLTEGSPMPMPTPEMISMPEPTIPMTMPEPEPAPPRGESELSFISPPSPPVSIVATRQPSEDSRSRVVEGLRDLLEDLRGQTQALWDGQLSTNRMLDDLIARRPPSVHPPVQPPDEDLGNRLRNIEGLLNNILRDLTRGGMPPSDDEPSEISSDTSSALRRYIDRLRDRRQEPLHMPTPVRAPPPNLESEWMDIWGEPIPSQVADHAIQGPPPLEPLYRRTTQPRADSVSLPPSLPSPTIRMRSAPLDESVPGYDIPIGPHDVRRRPYIWPRVIRQPRRPQSIYEAGSIYDPATEVWRPEVRRDDIPRPPPQAGTDTGPDDFLREVRRRRQGAFPGTDGFIDATRPHDTDQITFEHVPSPTQVPPRTHSAPPSEHITDSWYRGRPPIHPGRVYGDQPHEHDQTVPTPATPLPRPSREEATPVPPLAPGPMPGPMPAPMGVPLGFPAGIPTGVAAPPFNEMLDLLRQNRLAQTASIDQQREIMRYMRGLNSWLERDVRDRQDEMRGIGARVDALRQELGRLGMHPGVVPMPTTMPAQPQQPGPSGQTFIVPPLPIPGGMQPGVMPGGVIPSMSMPQPGMPFTPPMAVPGTGGPVIPPLDQGVFVPTRPTTVQPPVIPGPPRPVTQLGTGYGVPSAYGLPPSSEPFIPPRPPYMSSQGSTPVLVPPPGTQHPPHMIQVLPPQAEHQVERSESSSSRSSTPSSRRPTPGPQHISINVPSQAPPVPIQPSIPPQVIPQVERLPSGPAHPALSHYGSPQQAPQVPVIIQPPPPVSQPPLIVHSDRPPEEPYRDERSRSRSPYRHRSRSPYRSRSRSPYRSPSVTRIIVQPARQRRDSSPRRTRDSQYSNDSDLPHSRMPHRRSTRSEREPRSPRRRHRHSLESSPSDERDGGRRYSRSPPHVIIQPQPEILHPVPPPPMTVLQPPLGSQPPPVMYGPPQPQQPTTIVMQPGATSRSRTRSSSRSSSRSRDPHIIVQPHPPTMQPQIPFDQRPHTPQTHVIVTSPPPSQPPVIVPPPTTHDGRRYSPSPPPPTQYIPSHIPSTMPPQTPIILAPTAPTSYADRPHTPRRSSRSPGRGRSRDRTPSSYGDRARRRSPSDRGRRHPSSPRRETHDSRSPERRKHTHRSPERSRSGERPRRPSSTYGDPTDRPRSPRRLSRTHGAPTEGPSRSRGRRSPSPYSRVSRSPSPRGRSGRRPDYDEGYRRGLEDAARRYGYPSSHIARSPPRVLSPRPVTAIELERTPATVVHTLPAPGIPSHPEVAPSVIRVPSRAQPEVSVPPTTYVPAPSHVYSEAGRASPGSPTRVVVATTPARPESVSTVVIRQPPPHDQEDVQEPQTVTHVIHSPVITHRPPPVSGPPPIHPPETFHEISRPPTIVPSLAGRTQQYPSSESSFMEEEYHGPASEHPGVPASHIPLPTRPPPLEEQIRHSGVPESVPLIPIYEPVPEVVRTDQPLAGPPPSHVPTVAYPPAHPVRVYEPRTPSGPGDLDYMEDLDARRQRLEEQERHLEEVQQAALDAEDRREQEYREREEERQRIFLENEERRKREIAELRDELERYKSGVHHVPTAPSAVPPIETIESEARPETIPAVSFIEHDESPEPSEPSIVDSMRPVPPPSQPDIATELPQLQEILDMLRAQQADAAAAKEAESQRFEEFKFEIQEARADAKEECEERIRFLEEELARVREELENERGQRRAEELERIEREHMEAMERDEATRAQLGDITNLLHSQQDQLEQKRAIMEDRWAEKDNRRAEKQNRSDEIYNMLARVLQEREQDRIERENEKAEAASRPSIEDVLEALHRQNSQQIQLINDLTEAWRQDSSRQHQDTLDAVRATAQEMVPYNLTGYLDEFSKALAGEIRTLLGEVGRLHEQKRTIQFEISTLLHMHSQYGPGGQFEPDWHPPSMGPLAGPPPGDPGIPPPGPPPPGPDEPPPPAKPAWRTVQQQRTTRRKRAAKQEPPPQATSLAPPEPVHPSWATWQPNPAFAPTPPPGPSPLVVPPSGPAGLFGPRSPRGTMYAG